MKTLQTKSFDNFNYRLDYDLFSAGFSEVSGLENNRKNNKEGLKFNEIESEEQNVNSEIYKLISLKRGLIDANSAFFQWMKNSNNASKNLILTLFDHNNFPIISWKISNAFSINLKFSHSENNKIVAIEQLDLEFENLTFENKEEQN